MSKGIILNQLNAAVNALNRELFGKIDMEARPTVGMYELDCAAGRYKLVQVGHFHAERDVFRHGYVSKGVLYDLVWAMVEGVRAAKLKGET